jgi:hypothetical protein
LEHQTSIFLSRPLWACGLKPLLIILPVLPAGAGMIPKRSVKRYVNSRVSSWCGNDPEALKMLTVII